MKLVTVVLRSSGRPQLRDALQSLCQQDHTLLEVLVVDVTGDTHPALPDLPWRAGHSARMIGSDRPLSRPQAANVGLAAASGEWLCFLDEDNHYDADFVSSMLRHARQQPGRLLLYGHSREQAGDGSTKHVAALPFNRALMASRPLCHWSAALINRRVIALGCRFDERLAVCEDQDFLAQIAQHGDFALVPVTAFNHRAASDTAETGDDPASRDGLRLSCETLLQARWAGSSLHHTLRAAAGSQSGVAAYFRHDFAGARAAFSAALQEYPDDPNALHGLGRLDFEAQQLERARRQVERAIEINPDAAEFRLTLAQILAATDATESARAEAMQAARDPLLREAALALLSRLPSREAPVTATQQPARLSPCSCGSGRRYKDCHGKIGSLTSESEAPRPIDANATVIQQAGAAMQAGEATRAITLLSAVSVNNVIDATLAIDAGSLLLAAGDANAASPWFARALQLDADGPARALLRQCCERQYASIYADSVYREAAHLCRRLPPDTASRPQRSGDAIHIVTDFAGVGGSERHAMNLQRILAPHLPVRLWSTTPVHVAWSDCGITLIDSAAGNFPRDGTLVLIGQFVALGDWFGQARFHRLVIRNNIDQPQMLLQRLVEVELYNRRLTVQFTYPSAQFRERVGLPGAVEYSLTDLDRFHPAVRTRRTLRTGFTVGRHSRDHYTKHHPNDPSFFRAVARAGHRVRLMGASVIASALQHDSSDIRDRIEVVPAGAEPAADFLASLDCFIYRAHPYWYETGGNVIAEAMAMAIPVIVVGEVMGIAALIEHGVNGFCVATEEEALAKLTRLANDEMLRARIGRAARTRMEQLAAEQNDAIVAFYADRPRSVSTSMPLTAS
ncbi:glycosyltransferase [Casimicrobium huifangae]|uniref:glycosyltransferase n=1 Tax=Casimicrobium huifangae TaxID=2591109 RepID=UPI0012EC7C6C|nr:glycosyltransferase [Casimicrobium huifangae]